MSPDRTPEEERERYLQQFRDWRRANTVAILTWLVLVMLADWLLRPLLPGGGVAVALVIGLVCLVPAWLVRRAYAEGRRRERERRP